MKFGNYRIGRQPCQGFKAKREANAYAEWNNVHECFLGDGNCTVSFCENCHSDHHSNGYETCNRKEEVTA